MDNPEKPATWGTQDEKRKEKKTTTQYNCFFSEIT